MGTDRHRTRHETRVKDVVVPAGLDEVARFLERAAPTRRRNARSARPVMARVASPLRAASHTAAGDHRRTSFGKLRMRATFHRLKDFRRIVTRCGKLARNSASALALAAVIAFWR